MFKQEFIKVKNDYESDFNQKLKLQPEQNFIFYDDIKATGRLRGFFQVDINIRSRICLKILNEKAEILFSYTGEKYFFDIEIEEIGKYKIEVQNLTKRTITIVTFSYSSDKTKVINRSDIEKPKKLLNDCKRLVDNFAVLLKNKSNTNKDRFKSKLYIILLYLLFKITF